VTPDLRVKDLLYVVVSVWVKTADILKGNKIVTGLGKTALRHSVRMRAPLGRHDNSELSPKWCSSSEPYSYVEEIIFAKDLQGGVKIDRRRKMTGDWGSTTVFCPASPSIPNESPIFVRARAGMRNMLAIRNAHPAHNHIAVGLDVVGSQHTYSKTSSSASLYVYMSDRLRGLGPGHCAQAPTHTSLLVP
jgi:hypothetical protein